MEQMHDQFLEYAPITDSNTRKKRRDSELASNLTSKIEFGNSALFPSIVNHFGIKPWNDYWKARNGRGFGLRSEIQGRMMTRWLRVSERYFGVGILSAAIFVLLSG